MTCNRGISAGLWDAMPLEVQEQIGEQPAISQADADEIARALSDAKEVEA